MSRWLTKIKLVVVVDGQQQEPVVGPCTLTEALQQVCAQHGRLGRGNIKAAFHVYDNGREAAFVESHLSRIRGEFFDSLPYEPIPFEAFPAPGDQRAGEAFPLLCPRCHRLISREVLWVVAAEDINLFRLVTAMANIACPKCGEQGERYREALLSQLNRFGELYTEAFEIRNQDLLSFFARFQLGVYQALHRLREEDREQGRRRFETIARLYGLDGEPPLKGEGVAQQLGVSCARVAQLRNAAFSWLRRQDELRALDITGGWRFQRLERRVKLLSQDVEELEEALALAQEENRCLRKELAFLEARFRREEEKVRGLLGSADGVFLEELRPFINPRLFHAIAGKFRNPPYSYRSAADIPLSEVLAPGEAELIRKSITGLGVRGIEELQRVLKEEFGIILE